ncbi:MAG: hypothetical protein UZ17_ACD001000157 [Acidobacteria bacterium OLB17]|nr:MAG: hypothetical protein UZ17_ACD001000157 [Acidobacteria bacterium OLB17]
MKNDTCLIGLNKISLLKELINTLVVAGSYKHKAPTELRPWLS